MARTLPQGWMMAFNLAVAHVPAPEVEDFFFTAPHFLSRWDYIAFAVPEAIRQALPSGVKHGFISR
jgi:hypothetical protein